MTILHSWCCWRSVRKGSYACGIYTVIYYTLNVVISSITLHGDISYLKSCKVNCSSSGHKTILDPDTTSQSSMIFTVIFVIGSLLGILTCCLLLYGIYRDCKILLIPWILVCVLFTILDFVFLVYQFIHNALLLNPSVAILITIDLFLILLNIYALLCVISQYQELKAGRGRAQDDANNRVPNIHYSSQPTGTSYLSTTRRAVTYHETRPTPTQSPTGPHAPLAVDELSPSTFNKGPRKSVKFDASPTSNSPLPTMLEPWSVDTKSPMLMPKAADTAPLIDAHVGGKLLQSNL